MELMLDNGQRGPGGNGGIGRSEEASRDTRNGNWSFAIRIGLVVAAVAAAWLLMNNPWPAEFAAKVFGEVASANLPPQIGTLLAGIR